MPGRRSDVACGESLGSDREFAWLAVGRFETAKDYPNMLRAFARVRERPREAVLLLVGRGSLQAETEALARSSGSGWPVRFLGVRDDVPEFMSAADGYVMSSAWEGMPMVLLEAARRGAAHRRDRGRGQRGGRAGRESGFLVPPRDPGAGPAMLRLMAMSEEQRRSMGILGHEQVRSHYGLAQVAKRWEALYGEVLARKGMVRAPYQGPVRDAEPLSHVSAEGRDAAGPAAASGGAGGQR